MRISLSANLLAVTILATSTLAANADTFSYNFVDTSVPNFFTYTSPDLISTKETIIPTTCSIAGADCAGVLFDPADLYLLIVVVPGSPVSSSAYESLDLFSVGFHDYGFIQMTVTDNPVSPVPEPAPLALLGTGLLGLIEVTRRKLQAA